MPRPARVLAVSGALVAAGVVVGGTAHAAVSDAQPVEEAVELRVQPPEHGSGIQLICMADGTVTTTPPRPTTEPTTGKPTEEPVPGGGVVPLGQS